jgi:hypothetical protein
MGSRYGVAVWGRGMGSRYGVWGKVYYIDDYKTDTYKYKLILIRAW